MHVIQKQMLWRISSWPCCVSSVNSFRHKKWTNPVAVLHVNESLTCKIATRLGVKPIYPAPDVRQERPAKKELKEVKKNEEEERRDKREEGNLERKRRGKLRGSIGRGSETRPRRRRPCSMTMWARSICWRHTHPTSNWIKVIFTHSCYCHGLEYTLNIWSSCLHLPSYVNE